ncbi:hypothetical protein XELAEV_18010145mg [Xenopus laevis]|uniref:Uncharacterized protein n=1 Tax=Xenopus laevis TaxID=8355 RepID=A0A974DW18_XENLA|nr:hypothetical protein XELAEV_18010145mg [Xenopus laevis]
MAAGKQTSIREQIHVKIKWKDLSFNRLLLVFPMRLHTNRLIPKGHLSFCLIVVCIGGLYSLMLSQRIKQLLGFIPCHARNLP